MRIVSWGPEQGAPGTLVTIVGQNLGGARIFYGAKPKVPFEAAAGAEDAPSVNFNTAG